MTFIQPQKNHLALNAVIATLILALIMGAVWLVVSYNQIVDLSHNISIAKAKIDGIGAENTVLSNKIFAVSAGSNIANIAKQDNLIEDRNPQYFEVGQKWLFASQY